MIIWRHLSCVVNSGKVGGPPSKSISKKATATKVESFASLYNRRHSKYFAVETQLEHHCKDGNHVSSALCAKETPCQWSMCLWWQPVWRTLEWMMNSRSEARQTATTVISNPSTTLCSESIRAQLDPRYRYNAERLVSSSQWNSSNCSSLHCSGIETSYQIHGARTVHIA